MFRTPCLIRSSRPCAPAKRPAAMIIAGAFPEVLAFAARVAGRSPKAPKAARRRNGHGRRGNGHGREAPDQCDERLVKAMKANPGASIAALATAIGKSRTRRPNGPPRSARNDAVSRRKSAKTLKSGRAPLARTGLEASGGVPDTRKGQERRAHHSSFSFFGEAGLSLASLDHHTQV
jgi:hypothetical protein